MQRDGIDRRTNDRLRRGQMPVEARLDLHGMTQADAHAALIRFVGSGRQRGLRCVLVITGRGSPDAREERGVLKRMFPRWLATAPLRDHVLSYAQARQRDGGGGAFYVLLRRRK